MSKFTHTLSNLLLKRDGSAFRKRRRTSARHDTHAALEALEDRRLLSAVAETGVDDQQISTTGEASGLGSSNDVRDHAMAYNALNDEFLIVWAADDVDTPGLAAGEEEIFGQIMSGDGVKREHFRISDVGPDGDRSFAPKNPDVTWNAATNQYLVVWNADDPDAGLADNEDEIFGQLLNDDGEQIGQNDFLISEVEGLGNLDGEGSIPEVEWNPVTNEYLVVFSAFSATEERILGQRLDVSGQEIGPNDFPISNDFDYVTDPVVEINTRTGDYMVAWIGEPDSSDGYTYQVYGQQLNSAGQAKGPDDFQVSNVVSTDDMWEPDIAYNSRDNEYFVTWGSSDEARGLHENEMEIFGQIISDTGSRKLSDDIRISDAGGTGNDTAAAFYNAVIWNSQSNEYLVTWSADDTDSAGVENNYDEIFGQRLSADGMEVGENDFRFTDVADSSNNKYAREPEVAWNSQRNEYFVTFEAHAADKSREVFGQRLEVQEAIPLNLSSAFNRDIIANRSNGTNDLSQDQTSTDIPVTDTFAKAARSGGVGLPDDGYFPARGIHPAVQLDYHNDSNAENSARLSGSNQTLTVETTGSYFHSLYLYGLSLVDSVDFELVITYADGSIHVFNGTVKDWTDNFTEGSARYKLASGFDVLDPGGQTTSGSNHVQGLRFITDGSLEMQSARVTKTGGNGALDILGMAGLGFAPETLVVTTLDDEADGDMSADDLSLREALQRSQRNKRTQDTIEFDELLFDQTIALNHGRLSTAGSVNIVGPGADRLTIDGQGRSRILQFSDSAATPAVSLLSGVTLANGYHKSLTENVAGGALANSQALRIEGVAFRNSASEDGGAIYASSLGSIEIKNSEFSGNTADNDGGAIWAAGPVSVANSTFSNNTADGRGGAVHVRKDIVTLLGVTMVNNRADANDDVAPLEKSFGIGGGLSTHSEGTASVINSVIAMNTTGPAGSTFVDDVDANTRDSLYNLIGSTRGPGLNQDGEDNNQVGFSLSDLNSWFGGLEDNGGPTRTHALLEGNPAIDAGSSAFAQHDTDQRAGTYTRFVGTTDIGAFEVQPLTATIGDATANESDGTIDFVVTLSEAIPVGQFVRFAYGTIDASAIADRDFPSTSAATFTIDGTVGMSLTHTLSVPLANDNVVEATETFGLEFFNVIGVDLNNFVANGTIFDDDSATFTIEDVTVNEDDGTAQFRLLTDNPIDIPVDVTSQFTDVSASDEDYDNQTQSNSFVVGQTVQIMSVDIVDDAIEESLETFLVSLSSSTNLGDRNIDFSDTATGAIVDNEISPAIGDVDGDDDFDANDAFLIHLIMLSGSDTQIDQAKGLSTRTAVQIRDAVNQMDSHLDVDRNGAVDANDSFLTQLTMLAGSNQQLEQSKGSSPLTAAAIRANVTNLSTPSLSTFFGGSEASVASVFAAGGDEDKAPHSLFRKATPDAIRWQPPAESAVDSHTDGDALFSDVRVWIDVLG